MFGKLRNLRIAKPSLAPFRQNTWAMLLIAAVIGATQLTLLWQPTVGIYVNAGAFAVLVGLALWRPQLRALAVSTAILPTANMIMLSLPETNTFARTTVFYSALLVIGLIYRFAFTLDFPKDKTHLSLSNYAFMLPLMVVIGQLMGVIAYGMLRHHYIFDGTSLPLVAAAAVVFAVAEETVFRGLIQQQAGLVMSPVIAGLLSTVLFALMSIDSTTFLVPLFALLLGAVLSITYYKKQSVVLTITINAAAKLTYVGLMATFIFR
jgi:membrane protease YdiL (CAAX protease family)